VADLDALALGLEPFGFSPMATRLLVHMASNEEPHQSLNQMAAALSASKASMSTMARLLAQRGFLEEMAVRGSRRDHYRLAPGAWSVLHRERAAEFAAVARLAQGDDSPGLVDLRRFCVNATGALSQLAEPAGLADPDQSHPAD